MSSTIISCVVDYKLKFHRQAYRWLLSLKVADALRHLQPVIHYVGKPTIRFASAMNAMGAKIIEIDPFGSGDAVYCNKLQQLAPLVEHDSDYLILSDADLFFLTDPTGLLIAGSTRAKIVDKPNPPPGLLLALVHKAGFPGEELDGTPDFEPNSKTHRFNCNGGLYIFPKAHLAEICGPWRKWARFCLEQGSLLGRYRKHADQLGFMLAMIERQLPFDPLPAGANFPSHFAAGCYAQFNDYDVQTLHYHHRIGNDGLLLPTGSTEIDRRISQANEILVEHSQSESFQLVFQGNG